MSLSIGLRGVLAGLLALAWEGMRLFNGAAWSWGAVGGRLALAAVALGLSTWAGSRCERWFKSLALLWPSCLAACWWDLRQPNTLVAWVGVAGLYAILLAFESAFAAATRERGSRLARLEYGVGLLLLAVAGGVAPVVLAQVESQFAEEEFFVAVQAAFLSLFSLLLLLAQGIARRFDPPSIFKPVQLRSLWGSLGLLLIGTGFALWSGRVYQASFYTPTAPGYDGVSGDAPFLCASLCSPEAHECPSAAGAPDGQQVFRRILTLIEANPRKSVPEYGMLALVTGEQRWADAFRQAILAEAESGRFTEPANSVKYGQRLAALRAYYVPRIQEAFPVLFSDDELADLRSWFASINRRAMTVEWVDFLYGLAFSAWPEGPYENQENGAGLLALLESAGLGDDELSATNRDYLARNVRGWVQRFRNTDDAYLYQTEWIDSALFQAGYEGSGPDPAAFERHRRLAFEWLLLQLLPGGAPLTYNRPGASSIATTLYLGALLLDDPNYVWAADQALTVLEASDGYLYAQPGLEAASATRLASAAPTQGSCLLFSPSGLPTQVGPLAPDKVVFRDGWTADATYLLLNLRFTGWHRYKGTNGIVLLYHNGPVVAEESTGQPFSWLPIGRSLFRDKRIPRENLNGLLIPRSGFSQVVYAFSGLNGPWAQDPPHYARVEDFYRLDLLDASRTVIEDWRGWRHQRTVYFFHQGPVIVVDGARHPAGGQSALAWHLVGLGEQTDAGLWLRRGDAPLRIALPTASWSATTIENHADGGGDHTWDVVYLSPESGRLDLVTTFLMNEWAEADYDVQTVHGADKPVGQYVRLSKGDEEIRLLHNESSDVVTAPGLTTDGLALIVMGAASGRPHAVCALGGSQASLALPVEPHGIRPGDTPTPLQRGRDWDWKSGILTLWTSSATLACLTIEY